MEDSAYERSVRIEVLPSDHAKFVVVVERAEHALAILE